MKEPGWITTRSQNVQGVIKSFDPETGIGTLTCDSDLKDYDLAPGALSGTIFRNLRPGQRVLFTVDDSGLARSLSLGSEVDMGTPGYLTSEA